MPAIWRRVHSAFGPIYKGVARIRNREYAGASTPRPWVTTISITAGSRRETLSAISKYPIVTSERGEQWNELLTPKPWVILKVNGLARGIIGGMTNDLHTLHVPGAMMGDFHTIPSGRDGA